MPKLMRAEPRIIVDIALALSLLIPGLGCANKPRPRPANNQTISDKAVLDFSRGGGGLPLEGQKSLHTPHDLVDALMRGYRQRLTFSDSASPITILGGGFHRLDLLRIDVSDAIVNDDWKPKQFKKPAEPHPLIVVDRFEFVADPLRYEPGSATWRIEARNAAFGVIAEPGRKALVLTDASEGSLHFAVPLGDLRPIILAGAKHHSRAGFWVRDAEVRLASPDPRELAVEMRVQAVWMLLPATFRMTGSVRIDDDFNVHLSGLGCRGEDVGGFLLAGFIDNAFQKYEGRIMPLAKWPGDRIALTDVQIRIDDALRLDAKFGSRMFVHARERANPAG